MYQTPHVLHPIFMYYTTKLTSVVGIYIIFSFLAVLVNIFRNFLSLTLLYFKSVKIASNVHSILSGDPSSIAISDFTITEIKLWPFHGRLEMLEILAGEN